MMTATTRRAALLLLAAALGVSAAPAPVQKTGTVKDRANFIPHRKYQALPGKVVGILVSDVRAKMAHEGRGGPADAMGFSANGNSYRWVYVPVTANALISNLNVRVGEKGDRTQTYPSLSMASPTTVRQWNITVPYALVEVEVNNGQGAPAEEGFVGTKMARLDGGKDFPLDVSKTVEDLRKSYAAWKEKEKRKLDEAMADAQKKAIKDRKPTGPRETAELFYITWMSEKQRLVVRFRTTLTDGDYKYTEGGPFDRPRPLPLPVPPGKLPPAKLQAAPAPPGGGLRPPPPPPPPFRRPRIRYGTSFGIEYGIEYEVNKDGKVVFTRTLTPEAFKNETPQPPGFGGGPRRPFDLPPPPRKP